MAKLNELQINVGISISEETVARCLQLLTIYLEDNLDKTIEVREGHDCYDGTSIRRRNIYITKNDEE